ncbi:MAG: hypothetical protein AAFV43_04875 [Planctomycetota bacterium]
MDPFRLAIIATPVAAYLMLLGLINMSRRPLVVSGPADGAALGVALTGMALVGPIALLRPDDATVTFGAWVWVLLLALYWLVVALVVMLGRPRLVVYNATGAEIRSALSEAARQLDPEARWAGDSLCLPKLRVQLYLDTFLGLRNTTLVASSPEQDLAGWRKLGRAMTRAARSIETGRNPSATWMIAAGAALLLAAIGSLASDPVGVAEACRQVVEL